VKAKPPKATPAPGHVVVQANERGQLPFPKEWLSACGFRVGDEYALWKAGDMFQIAFPKLAKGRAHKIPKRALRGRIGRWNNKREPIIQARSEKSGRPPITFPLPPSKLPRKTTGK
jgi:hypothetical protein